METYRYQFYGVQQQKERQTEKTTKKPQRFARQLGRSRKSLNYSTKTINIYRYAFF